MNQTLLSGIEWKNHSAIPMFEDFSTEKNTLNRQKKYLLEELISSEIKYISYLKKILKYFAEPLSNSVLLPPDMHAEIFGRLSPILCVNETLLESVLTMGIEEAFLIIAPCLKLYADYARRYQTTLVLLEINELNGRRQPRLFVLLSDILIYATPQKHRHLRSGLSGLREKRKQARSIPRRGCRLQNVGRAATGQTSLYRPGSNHGVWFRRRLRHGFAYPPFERAWLDTVARPHPNQVHECPVDLLASRNVRFTCISVYPLHHCQIAPHFTIDSRPTDFVERSHSHFMFIDEKAVGRSPEYRTHLTFSANMEDTLLNRTGTAFTGRSRDSVCPNTPVSFDLGCLSQERNAFTVTCRDVSFTVDFDDRSTAEHWVVSLDTAISAVRMARQSLRKASSAKRPMPVADFVSYEQWLWRTDHQTHKPSNPPLSRISTLTESLGLHERNGLCNWLDSGRRLFHTCRRLTSPFSNLRDSGKVYVAETSGEIPRTGLSCLRSKSCIPLNYCISNEVRSEFFQSAFKENSVQLVGVHSQDAESVNAPAPQWSKISFTSFDDCSPTFASLSVSVAAGSPQHSSPLSHCQLGQLDSSGIASGCSTDTPTYASVDVSSEPVITSPCNQCRNSGSSRCSLM
ncbi:putative Guanine-nucleotide-exchange-factor [Fasciola gigantica]|uniref:Putative Guanine-nucleotide-exchange-factor n=1 Tax=Fasciola gigantica TaxID=46835 RepID=A0A504YCB5_FASGI|nr:putative Guanine-nucleotide-exchange-factor [Fasciola gigantica]